MYICIYVHLYICMYLCTYVHLYICMYICTFMCTYVHMYICTSCICVYIYIYKRDIYIYIYITQLVANICSYPGKSQNLSNNKWELPENVCVSLIYITLLGYDLPKNQDNWWISSFPCESQSASGSISHGFFPVMLCIGLLSKYSVGYTQIRWQNPSNKLRGPDPPQFWKITFLHLGGLL